MSAPHGYETLFHRQAANPILTAAAWPYPVHTVFNPAATRLRDGTTLLLCRVEDRRGHSHLCAARSSNGVDGWTINPNSDNIDLAVAFAKRMTQPDVLQIFADLAVHIPADTSVTTSDPLAEQFAAAVESGLPRPQVPQLGNFWGNFGDALNAVIDAGTAPADAVTTACGAMDEANGF